MEFFIGCIILYAICTGLAKLIDVSQEKTAQKNRDSFLEDIKKVCVRDKIEYQESESIKIKLPDNFGYKYDYINEVALVNSEGWINPALYWIDRNKNQLCFVGRDKSFKIELDRIEMYTLNGSIQYISKVKNTGKNVSIPGAIVGGAIAGTAGMIVGATKDRDNISTEIEEKDGRKVYIYYKDTDEEIKVFNVEKTFFSEDFNFDEFIKKELPAKSDTYLVTHQEKIERTNISEELENNLFNLKRLFEKGLINKDDYESKKKEILKNLN